MGTRGAYGFLIDGEEKVTYNHFDSYPSCLGLDVLNFLKETNRDELPEIARNIQLVKGNSKPTESAKNQCKAMGLFNGRVSEQSDDDWYCLLRNAQGQLNVYTEGFTYMIDCKKFLEDSLFCEWAYIINLDTKELEVYQGFNHNPKAAGRYAHLLETRQKEYRNPDEWYYGVELILTIPFTELNDWDEERFVNQLREEDEDE